METTSTAPLSECQALPSGNATLLGHAVHLHIQSQSLQAGIKSNFMSKFETASQTSIGISEQASQKGLLQPMLPKIMELDM